MNHQHAFTLIVLALITVGCSDSLPSSPEAPQEKNQSTTQQDLPAYADSTETTANSTESSNTNSTQATSTESSNNTNTSTDTDITTQTTDEEDDDLACLTNDDCQPEFFCSNGVCVFDDEEEIVVPTDATDSSLAEEILALASRFDEMCQADCAKDEMCSPNQALPAQECVSQFCGYGEYIQSEIATLSTQAFLACLRADLAVISCIQALDCQDHAALYWGEQESSSCSAEIQEGIAQCGAFYEN